MFALLFITQGSKKLHCNKKKSIRQNLDISDRPAKNNDFAIFGKHFIHIKFL